MAVFVLLVRITFISSDALSFRLMAVCCFRYQRDQEEIQEVQFSNWSVNLKDFQMKYLAKWHCVVAIVNHLRKFWVPVIHLQLFCRNSSVELFSLLWKWEYLMGCSQFKLQNGVFSWLSLIHTITAHHCAFKNVRYIPGTPVIAATAFVSR